MVIRISNNIPRNSHRYLIEELIGFLQPKVMLCSIFVGFQKSMAIFKKMTSEVDVKMEAEVKIEVKSFREWVDLLPQKISGS